MYKINLCDDWGSKELSQNNFRGKLAMEVEIIIDNEVRGVREQSEMYRSVVEVLKQKNYKLADVVRQLRGTSPNSASSDSSDSDFPTSILEGISDDPYDQLLTEFTNLSSSHEELKRVTQLYQRRVARLEDELENLKAASAKSERLSKEREEEQSELIKELTAEQMAREGRSVQYSSPSYRPSHARRDRVCHTTNQKRAQNIQKDRIEVLTEKKELSNATLTIAERAELSFLKLGKDKVDALELSKKNKMDEVKRDMDSFTLLAARNLFDKQSTTSLQSHTPSFSKQDKNLRFTENQNIPSLRGQSLTNKSPNNSTFQSLFSIYEENARVTSGRVTDVSDRCDDSNSKRAVRIHSGGGGGKTTEGSGLSVQRSPLRNISNN